MFENIQNWAMGFWSYAGKGLKKLLLLCFALTTIYFAWVLGNTFVHLLYFVTIGTLVSGYILFPSEFESWFDEHEAKFLGGSCGFITGGFVGLIVGIWLGYYGQKKYLEFTNKANEVKRIAEPVVAPIRYGKHLIVNAWSGIKNFFGYGNNQPEQPVPPIQEPVPLIQEPVPTPNIIPEQNPRQATNHQEETNNPVITRPTVTARITTQAAASNNLQQPPTTPAQPIQAAEEAGYNFMPNFDWVKQSVRNFTANQLDQIRDNNAENDWYEDLHTFNGLNP
jgi:hypothetical protein